MFNLIDMTKEMYPYIEMDALFTIGNKPSFVCVVLYKKEYSVSILLNEPENDDVEVSTDGDVEILEVTFQNLNEATKYYNNVRHPDNIAKIVNKYKTKE